jgi:GTP-binding protein HflX
VIGPEFARELADISLDIGRQVGVLVDRTGNVHLVLVGDNRQIVLPDLGRARGALTRLLGLRLIHTHVNGEGLTQDDINDLAQLRLDMVAALLPSPDGHAPAVELAHLVPGEDAEHSVTQIAAPHVNALDLDFNGLIGSLEEELARRQRAVVSTTGGDRALLVNATGQSRYEVEQRLAELRELARTAGLTVVDQLFYRQRHGMSRNVLSRERIQRLNIMALQNGADLLVFDQDLSPAQVDRLTTLTELRIIDRTQLILDIFAQRAQTREGKLQVEMAQLKYLLPRLHGKGIAMSRLTGGIGARGPGETKLEIDRRRVRERLARLKKDLELVKAQRERHRARRAKAELPIVSIVGYTNAGKSTLLNNLTQSNVMAENKLFATLDPSSRRLRFPRDRSVIITDTVGFIRDLPPDLMEAFSATLEELTSADLLLHVIDGSSPRLEQQIETVERLLADLELATKPMIRILNKTDLLDSETASNLTRRHDAVAISALNPATFPPLMTRMGQNLGIETE